MGRANFFTPLDEALDLIPRYQAMAAENAADTGTAREFWWRDSWLPVLTTGHWAIVVCECAVPPGAPSPIHIVAWGDDPDSSQPKAGSFGEMVAMWVQALDNGGWRYDRTLSTWVLVEERLDPQHLRTHLF